MAQHHRARNQIGRSPRRRPKILPLTTSNNELDRFAVPRVWSVMWWPENEKRRRAFMTALRRNPEADGASDGDRHGAMVRGAIAGELLLRLIELHQHHPPGTMDKAVRLVRAAYINSIYEKNRSLRNRFDPLDRLDTFPNGMMEYPNWQLIRDGLSHPIRRVALVKTFEAYRSVAHLWGALLIAHDRDRADLMPGRPETLPRFLATAEALAELAAHIPYGRGGSQRLLPTGAAWRFRLPPALVEAVRLHVPPLGPSGRRIVEG